MKKIIMLSAAVLMGTLAFASRTTQPSGSVVSVMSSGSELVRVFYKAPKSGNITISIINEKNEIVFVDKIKNSDGFNRPYNLKNLPEGNYTIQIADESGKQFEKVSYSTHQMSLVKKDVLIAKVADEEGKYVISGFISAADEISVKIYDRSGELVFEKKYDVDGTFGEVYNLKQLDGAFSISISDANGSLKEYKVGA